MLVLREFWSSLGNCDSIQLSTSHKNSRTHRLPTPPRFCISPENCFLGSSPHLWFPKYVAFTPPLRLSPAIFSISNNALGSSQTAQVYVILFFFIILFIHFHSVTTVILYFNFSLSVLLPLEMTRSSLCRAPTWWKWEGGENTYRYGGALLGGPEASRPGLGLLLSIKLVCRILSSNKAVQGYGITDFQAAERGQGWWACGCEPWLLAVHMCGPWRKGVPCQAAEDLVSMCSMTHSSEEMWLEEPC